MPLPHRTFGRRDPRADTKLDDLALKQYLAVWNDISMEQRRKIIEKYWKQVKAGKRYKTKRRMKKGGE